MRDFPIKEYDLELMDVKLDEMRDATYDERIHIKEEIDKISTKTGFNFYDLLEEGYAMKDVIWEYENMRVEKKENLYVGYYNDEIVGSRDDYAIVLLMLVEAKFGALRYTISRLLDAED